MVLDVRAFFCPRLACDLELPLSCRLQLMECCSTCAASLEPSVYFAA